MEATVERAPTMALAAVRRLAAGVAGGALAGVLVGGVGGRIAMLVLRLTSAPVLRGNLTDDGFTIGVVSTGTLFLLAFAAILGAAGGGVYVLVRSWLPERTRAWLFALLAGLLGGARILRPAGLDFTLLDPLPLAVAMFVAIPAAGGYLTSVLAERFLREGSVFARSRLVLGVLALPLPILLPLGGPLAFGALVILAVGVRLALGGPARGLGRAWRSAPVTWLGRGALALVGVVSAVELASDVSTIL